MQFRPQTILAYVMVAMVAIYLFFPSTSPEIETVVVPSRPDTQTLMNESVIRIKDFELTVRLAGGHAEFPADPNEPDGVKGTVELLPIVAKKEVIVGEGDPPRKATYVFSVAVVNAGGSGSFSYLLMYYDDGKSLGHVASAGLGDRVVIQELKVGEFLDRGGENFPVMVRILGREEGGAGGSPPQVSKVLIFRVKKDSETLTPEVMSPQVVPYVPGNPTIPPAPPLGGD